MAAAAHQHVRHRGNKGKRATQSADRGDFACAGPRAERGEAPSACSTRWWSTRRATRSAFSPDALIPASEHRRRSSTTVFVCNSFVFSQPAPPRRPCETALYARELTDGAKYFMGGTGTPALLNLLGSYR